MTHRLASCALAVISVIAAVWIADARAATRDWTGSAACGSCHPRELAAWQRTAHATTGRRLAGVRDGRCRACHATGEAPAGPAIELAVGCEACHGAGAAYAEDDLMRDPPVARALGLVDLRDPKQRAAVCMQCHARPTRGKVPGQGGDPAGSARGAGARPRGIDLDQPAHPLP